MPKLSASKIAGYLKQAGFPQNDLTIGVAISLAESGGNTDAINRANSNGTVDYGLMQINSIHGIQNDKWSDPVVNTRYAFKIYSDAKARGLNGWQPWSTFNNGAYRLHMAEAARGAANPNTADIPASDERTGGLYTDDESQVIQQYNDGPDFGDMISNPETWWRVGYFVAGLTFLVLAAGKMLAKTDVGSAAVGVVTKGLVKTK